MNNIDPNNAIEVDNLSKVYHIGALRQHRYRTLRDSLTDALSAPARRIRALMQGRAAAVDRDQELWALRDLSFNVGVGEVVGIIGRNGAGKSTLIKILSRITSPSAGEIRLRGRVGSLLEVGTGFHPELTGRENIFLNGAILGMTREEIARKFDDIVEFAELERFIETPVKHYSSGMYVRLAFAVAAHLEPEILLVDEVLSVGDLSFQRKCLGKLSSVARSGRTVMFISHNLAAVSRLCDRALLIEQGQLVAEGPTDQVISQYLLREADESGQREWPEGLEDTNAPAFRLHGIRLIHPERGVTASLDPLHDFEIELEYELLRSVQQYRVGLLLSTIQGVEVLETYDADDLRYTDERSPGRYVNRCRIPGKLLAPGRFVISIHAGTDGRKKHLGRFNNVLFFDIEDTGAIGSHLEAKRPGVVRPELAWDRQLQSEREQRESA